MKHSAIITIAATMLLTSCTINRYYVMNTDSDHQHVRTITRYQQAMRPLVKKESKIHYDKALPDLPKLSVIQDYSHYNPEDKYTFPIYGNEWAVVPPKSTNVMGTTAIWCTKEATIVAYLNRLNWDLHYFQMSSESYIVDSFTGDRYKVQGKASGIPLNMSYNIKGVSGEWVCSFDIYPPLPETCTVIDIVEGDVTDDVKNGLGWGGGLHLYGVSVSDLQANQHIATFRKTRIIE